MVATTFVSDARSNSVGRIDGGRAGRLVDRAVALRCTSRPKRPTASAAPGAAPCASPTRTMLSSRDVSSGSIPTAGGGRGNERVATARRGAGGGAARPGEGAVTTARVHAVARMGSSSETSESHGVMRE